MNAAYRQLAEASQNVNWSDETASDIAHLNDMTRKARELNTEEFGVSRTHLDYIAKSLLFSGNLRRPLTEDEVKSIYLASTLNRLRGVTTVNKRQLDAITKWLT
jgi:hypothetical protein